jgi:hypothetical protein
MGVSALDQAVLQIQGVEKYSTNGTSIPAGTYPLQYVNSISTLVFDNTTISNITYSLGVDNMGHVIWVGDSQYATRNSTDITWVYPNSVVVNRHDRLLVGIKTDFYSMHYLPITLSRIMNQTQFSGEGYQKASFTVSFENITYAYEDRLCDSIWTGFNTYENKNLNATLLPDTFSTDAPGTYSNNSYGPSFNWDRSNITLNRVYNFSIIIRVVPNGTSPVIFKPYLGVVLFNGTYRTSGTSGTSTTMPSDMLPPHMTYATASQNVSLPWSHYLLYGKGASFDEIDTKVSSAPVAKMGVFRPSTHTFYLKNNGLPTTSINWGISTDMPVTGDWNGDGRTDVGVFRNSTHMFYLKNGTTTTAISWGAGTDLPVTGDWNGDRRTEVGAFRPSVHTFYLKNGTTITSIIWGVSIDLPVTGDWNGDGRTDVGVFRPSVHTFYLKNGTTTTSISWGINTDLPVTGDWNGDGRTEVGAFRSSAHTFYLKNGTTTTAISWGVSTDLPVTGKW